MGCCHGVIKQATLKGKAAYADGVDVDAVAGYLRDPRNWISHLLEGSGGTGVACALQGPGTAEVSFTYQVRIQQHPRTSTKSGSAEVKRVDVQGDRAVVEVLVNLRETSSHYTYTLQRVSSTSSSQSGTTIEASVVITNNYQLLGSDTEMSKQQRMVFQKQTDALMLRVAAALSSPVVQGKPVR